MSRSPAATWKEPALEKFVTTTLRTMATPEAVISSAAPPWVAETLNASVVKPVAMTWYNVPSVIPAGAVSASIVSNTTRSFAEKPCSWDLMRLPATSASGTRITFDTVLNHPVWKHTPAETESQADHATTSPAGTLHVMAEVFESVPDAAAPNTTCWRA